MTIKTQNMLPCVTINPKTNALRSVIWLHGLGADGHDFASLAPELRLPDALGVRFIFPHAPVMPITLNNGYVMPAWFDITSLERLDAHIDKPGIDRSVSALQQLIAHEEVNGIPSHNIILAGFSQGGVIALATGLAYPKPLAGIMSLSSYLPHAQATLATANPANAHTPILIAHGTDDDMIPLSLGESTRHTLVNAGYNVTWHSYPMPHSVCADEVTDISHWIKKCFKLNQE